MPGLIDCHVHITAKPAATTATRCSGGRSSTRPSPLTSTQGERSKRDSPLAAASAPSPSSTWPCETRSTGVRYRVRASRSRRTTFPRLVVTATRRVLALAGHENSSRDVGHRQRSRRCQTEGPIPRQERSRRDQVRGKRRCPERGRERRSAPVHSGEMTRSWMKPGCGTEKPVRMPTAQRRSRWRSRPAPPQSSMAA